MSICPSRFVSAARVVVSRSLFPRVHACVFVCACLYGPFSMQVSLHAYVCMYVCMYMFTYMYMVIYICM